mmetsp:Transcript_45536/g.75920  ORF Transcript_45536/g.75920 Transcript_45536/m.75920 type:complete len:224 (-) Transcript_45536:586-1257(-)
MCLCRAKERPFMSFFSKQVCHSSSAAVGLKHRSTRGSFFADVSFPMASALSSTLTSCVASSRGLLCFPPSDPSLTLLLGFWVDCLLAPWFFFSTAFAAILFDSEPVSVSNAAMDTTFSDDASDSLAKQRVVLFLPLRFMACSVCDDVRVQGREMRHAPRLDEYSFNPRRMESFERGVRCKLNAKLFDLVIGATGRAIKVERGKAARLVKRSVVVQGVVLARHK